MSVLFLDFETRSTVDIKKAGADVYARHPSTDIMCMGFAVDDGPVQLWKPGTGHVTASMLVGGITMVAHNAPFEIAIWNNVGVRKYGWPPLKPENVHCTMAMSYAMALPGALADAAPAAGLTIQKDSAGHRIMMQLSQPRNVIEKSCIFCGGDGYVSETRPMAIGQWIENKICQDCYGTGDAITWYTEKSHPEKFEALYAYCKQDIEVERSLWKRLLRLSSSEREVWLLDHKINQRGVKIDVEAARKALALVEVEKERLNERIRELTSGAVATTSAVGQLLDWLKREGLKAEGVTKSDVSDLLSLSTLSSTAREVLLTRQEAAKSSTAKLNAMLKGVCEDGRLRGMFQYCGAGATGRFAGRRVQLQNMPRSTMDQEDIESVFKLLEKVS